MIILSNIITNFTYIMDFDNVLNETDRKIIKKNKKKRDKDEKKNIQTKKYESNKTIIEDKLENFNVSEISSSSDNDSNIIIKKFSISAYGKELFTDTDLSIIKGKKYALLGANGNGKSTLLMHLFTKKLSVPKNLDIYMIEQEIEINEKSVLEVVLESETNLQQLKNKLESFDKYNKDLTEDELKEYNILSEELNKYNPSYLESKAKKILKGLGFTNDMQLKPTRNYSGGWRMRISIARALFMEPEVLLLDEPTNHLDLNTVLWLENYLKDWKKTLLIVSHNQDFIDEVCTDIINIHNKKIKQYNCHYSDFLKMSEQIRESEIKEWNKYQKKIKDLKNNKTISKQKAIEKVDKQRNKNKNKVCKDISSSEKIVLEKMIKPKDYFVKFILKMLVLLIMNQKNYLKI